MEGRGIYFVEILQWGRILEKNEENIIRIPSVTKIHEPEPDRIPIEYSGPKFTEIPEWLFSKKVTSTKISKFNNCIDLKSIPENLFKNNVNVTDFSRMFYGCSRLTSIPEDLFKNNVNATDFSYTFSWGGILTSIPENLFKNNVNVTNFSSTFTDFRGLTSIPENLFKYNTKVTSFYQTFTGCSRLNNIPDKIIEYAKQVRQRGGDVAGIFRQCTTASNYGTIPSYMK